MRPKKQVVWSQGQQPERYNKPRLPPYHPPLKIQNDALRDAWQGIVVGEMLITTENLHVESATYREPHPIMYSGGGYYSHMNIPIGSLMVYVGVTHVDCAGIKNRTISKPYATVFYNGGKYLIHDQNHFKPVSF